MQPLLKIDATTAGQMSLTTTVTRLSRLPGLPSTIVLGLAALTVATLAAYFYVVEGWSDHSLATGMILATGAALLVLATRRVLFSVATIAVLVATIHIASRAKQQSTGITLHSYDLVSIVTGPPEIESSLAWANAYAPAGGLALAVMAFICGLLYRLDLTRVRRRHAVFAVAGLAGLTAAAVHLRSDRRHTEFFFEDIYVSSFLASWTETAEAVLNGTILPAAQKAGPKLAIPSGCSLTAKPPHIILIHQESVAPPGLFPQLAYDRDLDAMFRSLDGKTRTLRVETYGGASWLTEFSVMTGFSARDFGGMRHMVQPVMAGKVRETLPLVLGRCGYHRVMLYPMLRNFLSIDRFYTSIGIDEIVDARQQNAKRVNERDRFYFANLLNVIGRHRESRGGPIFAFVQTMSTHGDYGYTYDEDVRVPGGGPGTDPEMHEYLRRLAMARMDYDEFRASLARRFPGEAFLIVRYGDHQPTATRMLLGFPSEADVEAVMAGNNPLSFISYYGVDAVGYALPPLPEIDSLDAAFLGTVVIEAAGLPLSDTYRERRRLMTLCSGRYHDCPKRGEVLRFHRRLIDSDIVAPL